MTHPLVSIIIPAYNAEKTIADRLTAVFNLSEESPSYEVIVVDDALEDWMRC